MLEPLVLTSDWTVVLCNFPKVNSTADVPNTSGELRKRYILKTMSTLQRISTNQWI